MYLKAINAITAMTQIHESRPESLWPNAEAGDGSRRPRPRIVLAALRASSTMIPSTRAINTWARATPR